MAAYLQAHAPALALDLALWAFLALAILNSFKD